MSYLICDALNGEMLINAAMPSLMRPCRPLLPAMPW